MRAQFQGQVHWWDCAEASCPHWWQLHEISITNNINAAIVAYPTRWCYLVHTTTSLHGDLNVSFYLCHQICRHLIYLINDEPPQIAFGLLIGWVARLADTDTCG